MIERRHGQGMFMSFFFVLQIMGSTNYKDYITYKG